MLWLYNIGIKLYELLIRMVSPFNTKAALFIKGRSDIFQKLEQQINASAQNIWFHFASLGEFEQGRPVLERIRTRYPNKKIIITFFSPSGYEIKKNYIGAEGVFYLPLDTADHAHRFINAVNPQIAVFTKYEYWYHYFKKLNDRQIPLFVISGIFRPEQAFFKWYGGFSRKILKFVTHFFVQNEQSRNLLRSIDLQNISLSGDTRFDRVAEHATAPKTFESIANFCGTAPILVAGSTWPEDEQLLKSLISEHSDWKFIIAPHEVDTARINDMSNLFPGSISYSGLSASSQKAQVLIIDGIGLLSSLYQYGNIAYIGGGFGVGIHNTLEAAAFGIPVLFGPKYHKFQEAKDLISLGGAISVASTAELAEGFLRLQENPDLSKTIKEYIALKTGATEQILAHLQNYLKP
ncbi:MAG: glycosyltransferase N-terminal domain-containing protein [Bacteroidota bacterium]